MLEVIDQASPVFFTRQTPHGAENVKPVTEDTLAIAREAQALGISFQEIPESRVFALEYQGIKRYVHTLQPSQTSELAYHICHDKVATKAFLQPHGIVMPTGFHLLRTDSPEYQLEVFEALQKPLVVKPATGKEGKAITVGITTPEQFQAAVSQAFSFESSPQARVIVEETFVGTEYRVFVTQDKVVAITNREPANVIGDGSSTLTALIDQKNADPRRGDNDHDPLVKIKIDDHVRTYLTEQNLSLDFIPPAGQKVYLRRNSNISTGGDSFDATEIAHPSVHDICLKVVRAIPGLYLAGIDFMSTDITQPQTAENYSIIEVNSSPGITPHEMPYQGTPRPAAREFLYVLFPELLAQQ